MFDCSALYFLIALDPLFFQDRLRCFILIDQFFLRYFIVVKIAKWVFKRIPYAVGSQGSEMGNQKLLSFPIRTLRKVSVVAGTVVAYIVGFVCCQSSNNKTTHE